MTVHNTVLTNFIAAREYTNEYQDNSNHNGSHNGLPLFLQQAAAAMALLILSPFLIALAIMIRLESKGSPVFAQIRVGQNGRRFKFYKFRSMYTQDDPRWVDVSKMESDRDGVCKKFKQDPRITPIGRIIRKLSIDELPQLFNVLNGDMVLIGPRPALCSETDAYDQAAMRRLDVRPGITGLWQVSGRADTTFEEQIELDSSYIKNQSWWFDVKILLETVPAVLTSRGAY
ncbi:MAG: sugar transferase [Pseudomonadales bacterium]|nr:sugar transferase [Pseudomonadales bacterium]